MLTPCTDTSCGCDTEHGVPQVPGVGWLQIPPVVEATVQGTLVPGRYVFLLIGWNDYSDPVRDELNRQADAFGMDLGPSGLLVQAYPQRMYEIAREVLGKPWPAEIAERFESDQEPILLILDRDWQSFDPREHPSRRRSA
jgi:hypothetical protein